MSGIFAKFFPAPSSPSPSPSPAATPFPSDMENLCKAINELATEPSDVAGTKVAELTRKHKDMFEKKTHDIEAFLLNCMPEVGSAAMIASIKAMFDTSFSKNYEPGTDRAVELFKHYIDGQELVASHLKMVPELVFPLLRNVGFYCLEKKNEPEIGQSILISALRFLFPPDGPDSKSYVTSCHAALFACVLKTKKYELALPFLEEFAEEIYNELGKEESVSDSDNANSSYNMADLVQGPSRPSTSSRTFDKDSGRTPYTIPKHMKQGAAQISPGSPLPSSYIDPKFVLQYLYFGGLILIELEDYRRAMILLESCVSVQAQQGHDLQVESYKKYVLLSLLVHGYVIDIVDKSGALVRLAKAKMTDYKDLMDMRFKRGLDTHGVIEDIAKTLADRFEKDQNLELLNKIVEEMKRKAILAVVNIYSSIRIADIKTLANLKDDEESMKYIEELVNAGRLIVQFDKVNNTVAWNQMPINDAEDQIAAANKGVMKMNQLLDSKNSVLRSHPVFVARYGKSSTMYNDDEGLSMNTEA